jgi:hypothetical protein
MIYDVVLFILSIYDLLYSATLLVTLSVLDKINSPFSFSTSSSYSSLSIIEEVIKISTTFSLLLTSLIPNTNTIEINKANDPNAINIHFKSTLSDTYIAPDVAIITATVITIFDYIILTYIFYYITIS